MSAAVSTIGRTLAAGWYVVGRAVAPALNESACYCRFGRLVHGTDDRPGLPAHHLHLQHTCTLEASDHAVIYQNVNKSCCLKDLVAVVSEMEVGVDD